ncbi:hypothetical protein FB45DRAFT_862036 [Roridomyces roridus]|uniref:Uncharacterized protein n=1 Tax=Roridomyces roridus TaxID=1738132 RepID=A0AAD7FYL8_9AGAR|nr:hypothetical protein FB45DRAFT_862036 [Roridomyces roridus]
MDLEGPIICWFDGALVVPGGGAGQALYWTRRQGIWNRFRRVAAGPPRPPPAAGTGVIILLFMRAREECVMDCMRMGDEMTAGERFEQEIAPQYCTMRRWQMREAVAQRWAESAYAPPPLKSAPPPLLTPPTDISGRMLTESQWVANGLSETGEHEASGGGGGAGCRVRTIG